MRIRDPGIIFTLDPGREKFGSGIRDKNPGSAFRNTATKLENN